VKEIFFDGTPENFLSKKGISKTCPLLANSQWVLTVFGSTCCWRGELSSPASYNKRKTRASTWLTLQY